MNRLLRMNGVTFSYAGAAAPALTDISLEVAAGEVVALTGPAGAGTSTLLLVAGGYAPRLTGGTLTGERLVVAIRPAIVFATPWTQLSGLCQTVFSEVAFGPASLGWPVDRVRAAVYAALEKMGIARLAERNPSELSGGEVQRVIIAATLAMEPDLLLLDDPAAELDPDAADALYEMLPGVAANNCAVLIATPDQRAHSAASRTVRLKGGRL